MASQPHELPGHPTTATILLDHIPDSDRRSFLNRLIGSLCAEDVTGINFVAALVISGSDPEGKEKLLSLLESFIQNGELASAIAVSLAYPQLGDELLNTAVEALLEAKSSSIDDDTVQAWLRFSKSVISHLPVGDGDTQVGVFEACLRLLDSPSMDISRTALDVTLAMLAGTGSKRPKHTFRPWAHRIWETVQELVSSRNESHAVYGYSLWLRYILSDYSNDCFTLINAEYWSLLLHGLRNGDTERRKLCLNIVKLSITADVDAVPSDLRHQYERYCTVFETIVLGRYINQIQECESDLTTLAQSKSLDSKWLYVLLASGMDAEMQDSNRKFIGNWVMRSSLGLTPEFLGFFRDDFLPWAVQGQLFVSSLKAEGNVLRCAHGDALAAFVRRLQRGDSTGLVDAIVDMIHQRRNKIFAYAVVYLLEGMVDPLQAHHMDQIAEVKALPEVAREHVKSKVSTANGSMTSKAQSRREATEQAVIDKCRGFEADVETLESIWTDFEYLEYPKRLLMIVPKTIFNSAMIHHAVQDQSIAASLSKKLHTLQVVSSTKIFAFSPLVIAVRNAILTDAGAVSVLPIADFIISVTDQQPKPTIDFLLEEATLHLTPYNYNDFFGERPSYGFGAILDLMARLGKHQYLVETILNYILSRWKAQKVPPPTVTAWKNTLQLQVLILCFEQYEVESSTRIQGLLGDLLHILAIEPLPRYRYLLEATTVRFVIRFDLQETIIERLNTKDHHSNPKHLASLMKIGTILACREESSTAFVERLAASTVPLAASSKVVIRHEAQWQVPILMDHCRAKGWTSITENPAYISLDNYIRSLERFSDPPLERRNGKFNPETDFTMSNLVEGPWFDLDQMETPLTGYDDCVKLYTEELPAGAPKPCIPHGDKVVGVVPSQENKTGDASNQNPPIGLRTINDSAALQTKGAGYLARTLSDRTTQTSRSNDVIVIGSLVDNPYNLGGLSRVSEIFGASALTLQNQNVLSNKDFTSVSVSSHLHFPIMQLSAPNIPTFLAERKREGYTVVGIEQTDRSVMLGSEACRLPRQVVLVVGSEREGIPAVVLTECEVLVEIPQSGVTRSLNVQTAVAIVLFEHARQHKR